MDTNLHEQQEIRPAEMRWSHTGSIDWIRVPVAGWKNVTRDHAVKSVRVLICMWFTRNYEIAGTVVHSLN